MTFQFKNGIRIVRNAFLVYILYNALFQFRTARLTFRAAQRLVL